MKNTTRCARVTSDQVPVSSGRSRTWRSWRTWRFSRFAETPNPKHQIPTGTSGWRVTNVRALCALVSWW
jgi:hypothetical protein